MKQINLVKRQETIINNTVIKLKINNSDIVPVEKSNAIVITYTNESHDKTLNFLKNYYIQTVTFDPIVFYYYIIFIIFVYYLLLLIIKYTSIIYFVYFIINHITKQVNNLNKN